MRSMSTIPSTKIDKSLCRTKIFHFQRNWIVFFFTHTHVKLILIAIQIPGDRYIRFRLFVCLFNFMIFEMPKKASTVKYDCVLPSFFVQYLQNWFYALFYCLVNINIRDISIFYFFFVLLSDYMPHLIHILYLSVT